MSVRHTLLILTILLLTAGLCATASGQNGNGNGNGRGNSNSKSNRIPNMFRRHFDALGKRVKPNCKEKTIYSGELFDNRGGSTNARVILQFPGMVKLEGFKDNGASLSFDGERSHGVTSQEDEALLETFLIDFPEGMLASIQSGAAVRIMGRGFGPDPKLIPDYSGPRYDIYEVTGEIYCRQDQTKRTKRYYFDSKTGLLQSTRYVNRAVNPPSKIETRFSVWGNNDGSAYPARIDHYEAGQLKYTFIATEIRGEEPGDSASFE